MDQERIARLTHDILGDKYQNVKCVSIRWTLKTPTDHNVEFHCSLCFAGETVEVVGTGRKGLEVAFEALTHKFGERFPSLKAWQDPTSFSTQGKGRHFELVTRRGGQRFRFTRATISDDELVRAMVEALEFFVNAERAYAATLQGLTRAQKEGRADLISTHIERLAALVDVADFQEVVALVRAGKYPSL